MVVIFLSPDVLKASDATPSSVHEEETILITKVLEDGTVITETTEIDSSTPLEDLMKKRSEAGNSDIKVDNSLKKFMMGAELSTGLDFSGLDLSTFNFDVLFGYRHKFINLIGVQLGVHKSLGSKDSFLPICFVFRTSFTNRPSRFFFHLNVGYSFNTVASSKMFGDTTAAIGCGIKLSEKRKFQSNIILAFGYRHFNHRHQLLTGIDKPNTGFAQISFGVSI